MPEIPEIHIPDNPFSTPPHSAELEIERSNGSRRRARVEGLDGQECVERVLALLYTVPPAEDQATLKKA